MIKKICRIPFLLTLGYLAMILAVFYSILKGIKNNIIIELPINENIEMSEKYRK